MPATGAAVELLLDAGWTDITDRTYLRDRIRITRGRQDQGSQVDPGSCTLTLNNKQGYFSPRNPLSPLYGQIGRNTPVRISAVGGDPWLDLIEASSAPRHRATTPDASILDIVGDIDVRFDIQPLDWNAAGVIELGGKWAAGQKSWMLHLNAGALWFYWSTDGTAENVNALSLKAFPVTPRMCVRATLDVNDGAGGHAVTFYTAQSLAGPWTQLGNPQTDTGTTSIFSGSADLQIGDIASAVLSDLPCRMYGAEIRSGIGGTVVANPDFTAQTPGATSFTDTAPSARTWTVTADSLTNRRTRFLGEISAWPARWDVSGGDVYIPVQAAGILRRLGQGAAPLDSALRRGITDAAPLVYWPLEDGAGATQAASGLLGKPALPVIAGAPSWAATEGPPGSLPLPDFSNGGALFSSVPTVSATSWTIDAIVHFADVLPTGGFSVIAQWEAAGSRAQSWELDALSAADGGLSIQWANDDFSDFGGPYDSNVSIFDHKWHHVRITVAQSGSAISIQCWVDGTRIINASEASVTLGTIRNIAINPTGGTNDDDTPSLGHLAIWEPSTLALISPIMAGNTGEGAAIRYRRLCGEQGVAFTTPYGVVNTSLVGAQLPTTLLDLLEEAATADVGILYEARDSIALAYRPRWSLYNQTPALSLDYSVRGEVAPPLEPIEDDTATRNDITRSRPSGSSARVTLDEGALSTLAPPSGVGRYQDSQTVNVHSDDQLPDVAGWLLHLGTVDEPRYPAVTVNLAAGPWLAGDAMTVDLGDLITIANPPVWLPPGTISLMVQGYAETLGVFDWTLTYNCTPASPWEVGVRDDPARGRRDTAGASLATAVNSTATTLSVATAAGPLWTTAAGDYPLDLLVGGEVVTATACTGASSPQSMTVTRGVNGITRGWDAGTTIRLAQPCVRAL